MLCPVYHLVYSPQAFTGLFHFLPLFFYLTWQSWPHTLRPNREFHLRHFFLCTIQWDSFGLVTDLSFLFIESSLQHVIINPIIFLAYVCYIFPPWQTNRRIFSSFSLKKLEHSDIVCSRSLFLTESLPFIDFNPLALNVVGLITLDVQISRAYVELYIFIAHVQLTSRKMKH